MKIVFATNNKHKLFEVKNLFADFQGIEILSLQDINFHNEIPEDFDTLDENALQKAKVIRDFCGLNVLSDDTGLEVEALNGRPGVFSARYAGPDCSPTDNVIKLLDELKNQSNRKAAFRTVAALILDDKEFLFEGKVDGEIISQLQGKDGFGYDPVFKPIGYDITFAQMDINLKNKISHRALAFNKLKNYLEETL